MGDFVSKRKHFSSREPNAESGGKLGLTTSNVNNMYKCLILAQTCQMQISYFLRQCKYWSLIWLLWKRVNLCLRKHSWNIKYLWNRVIAAGGWDPRSGVCCGVAVTTSWLPTAPVIFLFWLLVGSGAGQGHLFSRDKQSQVWIFPESIELPQKNFSETFEQWSKSLQLVCLCELVLWPILPPGGRGWRCSLPFVCSWAPSVPGRKAGSNAPQTTSRWPPLPPSCRLGTWRAAGQLCHISKEISSLAHDDLERRGITINLKCA